MRRARESRLHRLRAQIPEMCAACREWPLVWIMTESGPEPLVACARCGRRFQGGVRVYLRVDPDTV